MKIYCAHSSLFDFRKEFYEVLDIGFQASSHIFIFPHQSPNILANSKENIRTSDFLLAEVSYPATGLGIEMGWADSFGVPILAVYQAGKIPSKSITILTENVTEYTSSEQLINIVRKFIEMTK